MMVATRRLSNAVQRAVIPPAIKSLTKKPIVQTQQLHPAPKAAARAAQRVASGPRASKKLRAAAAVAADTAPLIDLGELEECEMLRRPSARNKSPYVADVRVLSTGAIAIAHCPNLDSGGKCVAGTRVLCSRQAGVNSDTVGAYGTPKCELVIRLLRCHEPEYHGNRAGDGVWVSAHPALTESLTLALIKRGALDERLAASPVDKDGIETQRAMKRLSSESASGSYRPDYRLNHKDGSVTILEVKQVVDTDYDPAHVEARARMQAPLPVYSPVSHHTPASLSNSAAGTGTTTAPDTYQRAGIFPWGKRSQKGPDGQLVVSARAIDHVRELTKLADTSCAAHGAHAVRCAILFVCGRSDAVIMRPNGAACPTFARYLNAAREKSCVKVLCHRVRWGQGADVGKAYDDGVDYFWIKCCDNPE
jgi:DNA-binding sugar fermentation-stimulating protein